MSYFARLAAAHSKLRFSTHWTGVLTAVFLMALGGFTAGAALAQPIESVVVTGVKTGQDDARSVSPTTNLEGISLTQSGNTTLEQVFQSLPFVNQGVGSTNSGGFGVYFVDLRSLNFNRTLTMVDG